jgi:hypothetical protein
MIMMFLRRIQLIFSSLVKTQKIEKCFMAHNNISGQIGLPDSSPAGLEKPCYTGNSINILGSWETAGVFDSPSAKFSIPVQAPFCCNGTRVTIFIGTCAPLAPLR